jgi:hypothetical protein
MRPSYQNRPDLSIINYLCLTPIFPREEFRTQVERKFVEDLIVYLDYKIREGERIRTERKQLSFW